MKKLDEIMELMADEMADFEKGLHHLEKLNSELQQQSIPISTEVLEKHLYLFFQQQEKKEAARVEILRKIEEKLQKAYILPKSLGILLVSLMIILLTLIGYLSYEVVQNKREKIEVYQQSKEKPVLEENTYISSNRK